MQREDLHTDDDDCALVCDGASVHVGQTSPGLHVEEDVTVRDKAVRLGVTCVEGTDQKLSGMG